MALVTALSPKKTGSFSSFSTFLRTLPTPLDNTVKSDEMHTRAVHVRCFCDSVTVAGSMYGSRTTYKRYTGRHIGRPVHHHGTQGGMSGGRYTHLGVPGRLGRLYTHLGIPGRLEGSFTPPPCSPGRLERGFKLPPPSLEG